MKYYVDYNYPGEVYVVPEEVREEFEDHMTSEGAALGLLDSKPTLAEDEELFYVKGVRHDSQYWGLVLEEKEV